MCISRNRQFEEESSLRPRIRFPTVPTHCPFVDPSPGSRELQCQLERNNLDNGLTGIEFAPPDTSPFQLLNYLIAFAPSFITNRRDGMTILAASTRVARCQTRHHGQWAFSHSCRHMSGVRIPSLTCSCSASPGQGLLACCLAKLAGPSSKFPTVPTIPATPLLPPGRLCNGRDLAGELCRSRRQPCQPSGRRISFRLPATCSGEGRPAPSLEGASTTTTTTYKQPHWIPQEGRSTYAVVHTEIGRWRECRFR